MVDVPPDGVTYEVDCPHCKKHFSSQLMTGPAERHQGFKCPHCRLFVPYHRADEQDRVAPAE